MLEEHIDWLTGGVKSFETELDERIDNEYFKKGFRNVNVNKFDNEYGRRCDTDMVCCSK